MRGKEQSLEQQAVHAERRAALAADPGSCQTHRRTINQFFFAGDISARRSNAAAGIFDE